MERNARIILVATFLLLTLAGLMAFYQWIQGPDAQDMGQESHILFDGSVSGLSIGSDVRYLGVPIGRVTAISLSRDYPGRVEVVFATEERLPPSDSIVATLQAQGITGLSVIELQASTSDTPGFDVPPAVIPGYPSLFSQLAGSASRITVSVESTLGRLDRLLNDETAEDLSATITQMRILSANLASATGDIDQLLASAGRVSEELEASLPGFTAVAQRLDREVLPTLTEAGRSLKAATDSIAVNLDENSEELSELLGRDLPTLVGMTDELARTLQELDQLLGNINDEPGALLYGEQVKEVEINRD